MKFSTREDIEAPIEFVYQQVADFDGLEKQALRRGYALERVEAGDAQGMGTAWNARVPFRGKTRELKARISDVSAPTGYCIQSQSGGLGMDFEVELVALSRNRTRVVIGLEVRPNTLSSRLLVQSMKFAKSNLQKRFSRRVGEFAVEIGDRYTRV
ncbi:MAG: hypothetical protein ACJA06_000728 [Halocynthiibacter sp.]|jgi:hypothetical protein